MTTLPDGLSILKQATQSSPYVRIEVRGGRALIQADPTSTVENVSVGDKVYSVRAGKVTVRERRGLMPSWYAPLLCCAIGFTVGTLVALTLILLLE